MNPAPPRLVVHCVHGTFPRGAWGQLRRNWSAGWAQLRNRVVDEPALSPAPVTDPERRYWFEDNSPFLRVVQACLRKESGAVRFERVLWSGNNSFRAREDALVALRVHLKRARKQFPEARHLVLAHSHGGTVATDAVATTEAKSAALADAVMTLGTPFVRLMLRVDRKAPSKALVLIGALLPTFALLLAPLLAVSINLRQETSPSLTVPLTLLTIVAVGFKNVPLAASAALLALVMGGAHVRSDVLALALLALGGALLAVVKTNLGDELSGLTFVQSRALKLPCPLLAVRTPNDEASLVIGLAQMAERGYRLIGGMGGALLARGLEPWRRAEAAAVRVVPWVATGFIWIGLALIGGLLLLAHDFIRGITRAWWELIPLGFYVAGIGLLAAAVMLILVWLIPAVLLSFAVGSEAFSAPLVGVDAEPLPFATPENAMTLIIDVKAGRRGGTSALNHSLHDLPRIRLRVAQWIKSELRKTTVDDRDPQ